MNAKKGFTLIEIMIVVAIIAILAAIAIPNFISYRKSSQKNACLANLRALDAAAEALFVKDSTLAGSTDGTANLTIDNEKLYKADGTGIMKTKPVCPCSGTYKYDPTKQLWTCTYTDTDTDYSHTR